VYYTKSYSTSDIKFISDGSMAFTSLQFTGRLDRQMLLFAHLRLLEPSAGGELLDRTEQLKWYQDNVVNTDNYSYNKYYSTFNGLVNKPSSENYIMHTMLSNVNFSPYVGIKVDSNGDLLTTLINMQDTGGEQGFFSLYKTYMIPGPDDVYMGAISRVYSNDDGGPLSLQNWINKYNGEKSGGYFAISKRFEINHKLGSNTDLDNAKLIGGDCYSGLYYQRVWRPGGIDGVPLALTPADYKDDNGIATRLGTGITASGYAIGFPVRSRYNFAIRALQEDDEIDLKLYGSGKTYTPSDVSEKVHGNRQAETSIINYGNFIDDSIIFRNKFSDDIPYSKIEYKNRILASNVSAVGEFENGYRDFRGLNYKDYDEDLGEIVATVSSGTYTYVVYTSGVALVEVSERTAITKEDTGTNVYLAASDILPPKSTPILTSIGSQHLHSVITTESYVFGVDAASKKIWMLNKAEKSIISDTVIQSLLNKLITDDLKDITSSYDQITYEVTFTFIYDDDSKVSLVYNSMLKVWYGISDITKLFTFNIEGDILFIRASNSSSYNYGMYRPIITKYDDIYPTSLYNDIGSIQNPSDIIYHDAYIEFVIKAKTGDTILIPNIIINGSGVPESLEIMTEVNPGYIISRSPSTVSGVHSNNIPMHTNILTLESDGSDIIVDGLTLTRPTSNVLRDIKIGDNITLTTTNGTYQYTVADVTNYGLNTRIVVDRQVDTGTVTGLYYGWKIPYRITIGEIYSGRMNITIPSANTAAGISGNIVDNEKGFHNRSESLPYGRWIKIRLNFSGLNPVYINNIISRYNTVYS
jgi:hypothetical protein